MTSNATTVSEYLSSLPTDRQAVIERLREVVLQNLPAGFEERMTFGMIGYVIPLSRYPAGYHVQPGLPLLFLALASQKNHIALYHMGLYADLALERWFADEYARRVPVKLDMGKSCIRFRNPKHIPYDLIGELCRKVTVDDYVRKYEQSLGKSAPPGADR